MARTVSLCMAAALLALGGTGLARAGTLDVELSNLRPAGQVRVEVYADAGSWQRGRPLASQLVTVREVRQTVRFDGLAPGRYAVRARQELATGIVPPLALPRSGSSGNGSHASFAAAAVEVIDDPLVQVHLSTDEGY
jgi:uncharacterized protein (DUF2141 family)